MRFRSLHSWQLTPRDAIQLQHRLRSRIRASRKAVGDVRFIAGADISWDPLTKMGFAGVIVFRWPGLEEVERASAQGPAGFPYVPGLLSFREGPLLLQAFEKLRTTPDLIFFDGHGYAHPRRMGIATHMGLLLRKPSIGCAKSRLVGEFREPAEGQGARSRLTHEGEAIGAVLRSKNDTSPLFISIGNRITLAEAIKWTLACCDGQRVPKPTREADRFVDQLRRSAVASSHVPV